ncbi:hypothetical protein ACFZB9_32475 [Kitasatospora sp. NPDC008050]|uniref:hypothetical protein n=1 Tax=Kitasatospora sp. NPDC008050 TaxID=3364021 RepID=UPI0036E60129
MNGLMDGQVRVALAAAGPDRSGLLAQLEPPAGADAAPLLAQLTGAAPYRGPGVVDEHLSVDLAGPGGQEVADVLHGGPGFAGCEAELLAAHPGCLVVAVGRTDGSVRTRLAGADLCWRPLLHERPLPAALLGSLLHAWLVAGLAPAALHSVALLVPGGALRLTAQSGSGAGSGAGSGTAARRRSSFAVRRWTSGAPSSW